MTNTEYPEHWTESAEDTYDNVLGQVPDLAGAAFASLVQACELIAAADHLDTNVRDSMLTTGSTGQVVVHGAVVESRLARTAAAQILARLTPVASSAPKGVQRAARARAGRNGLRSESAE